jgi:hypothetical protein
MLNFNLKKLSIVFAGTAAVMIGANSASATSITIQPDPNPIATTNGLFTSLAGAQTIDFNNGAVPTSGEVTFSTQTGNNLDNLNSANNGTSSLFNGNSSGIASAPAVGNANASGKDTSDYLAVEPGDDVTLKFAESLSSFGLDWGSVDGYNSVSFYNGSTLITTLTGNNVPSAYANGDQYSTPNNPFVNFIATGGTFNKVVLDSTSPAFEIDNISYKVASTPESSSLLGLLAFGVVGGAAVLRKKSHVA